MSWGKEFNNLRPFIDACEVENKSLLFVEEKLFIIICSSVCVMLLWIKYKPPKNKDWTKDIIIISVPIIKFNIITL